MDNSFIAQANIPDKEVQKEALQERDAKLVKIIEALGQVEAADEWRTLREELFDSLVENLEHRLVTEAKSPKINTEELYRLQGQLLWAKRYSNLGELRQVFKVEQQNIRNQING